MSTAARYQCFICSGPVPEPMVCDRPECQAEMKRHAPSCRCLTCNAGGETRSLSWTGCTCPYSEKDPDAMCSAFCKCLACHPERSAAACNIKETSRKHQGVPLPVTPEEARRALRNISDPEDRDQDACDLLQRYIDQQETAGRRLEIWAHAANGLLGAMANGDDEAQRLAYGRLLKLVDGHWPECSPSEPQVATFVPGSEPGANPAAATPGGKGRDRAGPPDAAVVSAAVNALRIRTLLATATRQANDGEHADSQLYHRHFTCLAIENVARAVALLADRLVPLTPEERRILDSQ